MRRGGETVGGRVTVSILSTSTIVKEPTNSIYNYSFELIDHDEFWSCENGCNWSSLLHIQLAHLFHIKEYNVMVREIFHMRDQTLD